MFVLTLLKDLKSSEVNQVLQGKTCHGLIPYN